MSSCRQIRDLDTILSVIPLCLYSRGINALHWLFRKTECDLEPDVAMVEIKVILSVPGTLSDSPTSRHLLI